MRQYRESFDVYGTKISFEREQLQVESHVIFVGGGNARRIAMEEMLISAIPHCTKREKIDDPNQVSFLQGAGHGGSHPHLLNKFLSPMVENRNSAVAANYTCAGICAHESAKDNGKSVKIPTFDL